MKISRRTSLKIAGSIFAASLTNPSRADGLTTDVIPPRMPLHEFVKDTELMNAFRRGVRAMKARKPSDPLSWFYQAAIHGVTVWLIKDAYSKDSNILNVDQKKYWNQCPHFGQSSANFLPWHRAYTYYFERILRAHSGNQRFALPYWDYSLPENYQFPRDFGIKKLDQPLDGDDSNPLYHSERNIFFTDWQHWSDPNHKPYTQLTPEAVDWSPARDSKEFFGITESLGLAGSVGDDSTLTRGRLESFPHDPIHRLVGGFIPQPPTQNPNDPNEFIECDSAGGIAFPPTAGFDPIFCVHHSNLDRLWAEWSVMPGKAWGNFPPQNWFDGAPWIFFDIAMDGSDFKAVEINRARKDYFDYRALGISFQHEDKTKTPLVLPDPIPAPPPNLMAAKQATLVAEIGAPVRIMGLLPERIPIASVATTLNSLSKAMMESSLASDQFGSAKRSLLKLSGVHLSAANSTGFDVHLTSTPQARLSRSDPSFVGTIALFRHNGFAGHEGHGGVPVVPSDTFDVTEAMIAAGEVDYAKLFVVVVPFSLSATIDGKKFIESNSLRFEKVEFYQLG